MVLGKLPVPGRPTTLITVGQGPIALEWVRVGVVWTFLLTSILSLLSPSLWETARYRLKYCLKGPLHPKQPTKKTYLSALVPVLPSKRKRVSRVGRKPSETDSIKSQISPQTSRGKKDSTKRRHQRHHQRQTGKQLFPIQVVTGLSNIKHLFLPISIFIYNKNDDKYRHITSKITKEPI